MMAEGRVAMFDVQRPAQKGTNIVVLDVASHTEKGNLNDQEKEEASRRFESRQQDIGGCILPARKLETSGARSRPIKPGRPIDPLKENGKSPRTTRRIGIPSRCSLRGQTPIDEGPGLDPIIRKDFANEPVDVSLSFHTATTHGVAARQYPLRACSPPTR